MAVCLLRALGLLVVWLPLVACTGLRDMGHLGDMGDMEPAAADPSVSNGAGPMGAKAGKSLLASRWKNSYVDVAAMAVMEEAATKRPLISGNKVTLLYDGPQTMAAMMQAIAQAKDHINLETYIFDHDAVGIAFADLLIEKQRAGVQVHVIYDAIGTISTPQAFFDTMRDAGIRLLSFNPVNPLKLEGAWEPNQRDHRKILVVDGAVAFTGGVNISSTYANSSLFRSKSRKSAKVGWRDTHIKIEGPAVAALQWEFLNSWTQQTEQALGDGHFFPTQAEAGKTLVRILASAPDGDQEIYQAYILAIGTAKKSVHITSAYFVPDAQMVQALTAAALRGVDVKIILPGVKESGLAFFAGHSFYSEMLASGVKIYQLQLAVLHAKTAVVDSLWSTVGSTNIDTRSFLHNYEVNAIVYDEALGQAMEAAFDEDLGYSVEISKEKWEQRPYTDRLKEWAARLFQYWL